MERLDGVLIGCGLFVAVAILLTAIFGTSRKEQCLNRGGTSVEFQGEFVRCIEP
jgi:hypothetical protein